MRWAWDHGEKGRGGEEVHAKMCGTATERQRTRNIIKACKQVSTFEAELFLSSRSGVRMIEHPLSRGQGTAKQENSGPLCWDEARSGIPWAKGRGEEAGCQLTRLRLAKREKEIGGVL